MPATAMSMRNTSSYEANAGDFYDPGLPTCGIAEAIASLPPGGGRVRVPAGTYLLRRSIYVSSRVSLVGEGPATVLTVYKPRVVPLERDLRKGRRVLECSGCPPFKVGDEIGVSDEKRRGWWGTHGIVERIEGRRVWISAPFNRGLRVERQARAVSLFPAVWAQDEADIEVRDLTVRGPVDYDGPWWDFTYSGIHLVGCARVRVINCTLIEWPSDGIGMQRGCDAQVIQCQAHGCRGHGFHPGTGLGRSVWSHNIGRENGGDGFFFCARVHHTVCSNSVFSENMQHGIGGVANGGDHHNIISDNVCSYNGRCGIDASRGEEQVITGNLLLGNSREAPGRWPGIRLDDLQRAVVQGNRCADDQDTPTQKKGIVESGTSDDNLISGNLCLGMEKAVVTVGGNSRAEGNLV